MAYLQRTQVFRLVHSLPKTARVRVIVVNPLDPGSLRQASVQQDNIYDLGVMGPRFFDPKSELVFGKI
ncbi:MAG: hypothetical protein WA209_08120 [Candidatus Acidiferrales bacterium]